MNKNHPLQAHRSKIRRKCIHCNELFIPDVRNRHHQQYCSNPKCRAASKAAAHHKWLSSSKGRDYFKGPKNTLRVQLWRKDHPDYCKATPKKRSIPLQDLIPDQVVENKGNKQNREISSAAALQDLLKQQHALIIGLISHLTSNTLQDDIAKTSIKFINLGLDILNSPLSKTLEPKGVSRNDCQTDSLPGSSPQTATAL